MLMNAAEQASTEGAADRAPSLRADEKRQFSASNAKIGPKNLVCFQSAPLSGVALLAPTV